jgi:cyclophilin family peptidyl-prolyl cis-trans isomerase
MADQGGMQNRLPVVIGSGVVVVIAIVAIAFGVNNASSPLPALVSPTPTAVVPTPSATPSPTAAATIPFASCSSATFGPALAPINPPASVHTYAAAPAMTIDTTKLYQATITTSKGAIVLCLQPNLAPNTVNVFVTLARNHFYDGIPFHRVCPNSADTSCGGTLAIIQGGDPNCIGNVHASTCGQGGPGYKFNDEPVHQQYSAGSVAMANSGPNTNGSQFFIDTGANQFAPSYNLFGKVVTGLDVAKKIVQGDVMRTVTITVQQ